MNPKKRNFAPLIITLVCIAFWIGPYVVFGLTGRAMLWSFAMFGALVALSVVIAIILGVVNALSRYKKNKNNSQSI